MHVKETIRAKIVSKLKQINAISLSGQQILERKSREFHGMQEG